MESRPPGGSGLTRSSVADGAVGIARSGSALCRPPCATSSTREYGRPRAGPAREGSTASGCDRRALAGIVSFLARSPYGKGRDEDRQDEEERAELHANGLST